MGLFDSIREKATELLGGASDQVSGLADNLPGGQAVEDLTGSATDAAQDLGTNATDAAQDLGTTATDSIGGAADTVSGTIGETTDAASDAVDPYRP